MNINHFEFLFKCKDLDGAQESNISNRLLEMVSHLSEPHWVARVCWITRKPNIMVGQFLYLPGLELQKLSLAKSTDSPKGKFTFKKKKKRFQLAEASSKGKMTLPRDILFSFSPQGTPRCLSQKVPFGSLPYKGDSEKNLMLVLDTW